MLPWSWVLLCLITPWYVILDTKWKCFRRWQIRTDQETDAWRQRIIKSRPTDWQKWWWLTRNCYRTLAAHFKINFSILVFSNVESYIIILNNGHMFDLCTCNDSFPLFKLVCWIITAGVKMKSLTEGEGCPQEEIYNNCTYLCPGIKYSDIRKKLHIRHDTLQVNVLTKAIM